MNHEPADTIAQAAAALRRQADRAARKDVHVGMTVRAARAIATLLNTTAITRCDRCRTTDALCEVCVASLAAATAYLVGDQAANATSAVRDGECVICQSEEHSWAVRSPAYLPGTYTRLVTESSLGHDAIAHRLYRGLLRAGVTCVEQLAAMTDSEIEDIRNCGQRTLALVRTRFPAPPAAGGRSHSHNEPERR